MASMRDPKWFTSNPCSLNSRGQGRTSGLKLTKECAVAPIQSPTSFALASDADNPTIRHFSGSMRDNTPHMQGNTSGKDGPSVTPSYSVRFQSMTANHLLTSAHVLLSIKIR